MTKRLNRRQFLGQASCAAVGSTTFLSTLAHLCMTNSAAAKPAAIQGDYKALVCILLAGGIDSHNLLVPSGNPEYSEYSTIRSNLAIPQGQLLGINPITGDGKSYGIHPNALEIQQLFESQDLAWIVNVGSLVEPTDKNQYENNLTTLPLGLFSHSDQIKHWQTSIPQSRNVTGWGGRMADMLSELNTKQNVSMNISLSGDNIFQTGKEALAYSIKNYDNGSSGITGYNGPWSFNQALTPAVNSMLTQQYSNLMELTYRDIVINAQEVHEEFSGALANSFAFTTTFPDNSFADSLKMIARTISVNQTLGMNRMIFFLNYGGWDHHDNLLTQQQSMLPILAQGLKAFYDSLGEINMQENVTTFSISDFGRTLTSNGNGSDHAWAGNQFVIGGAVKGKELYGTYPDLVEGGPLDLGRGRIIPTASADEYFAELALWFGVPKADLDLVLPNITNFYSLSSNDMPMGFMDV